MEKVLAYKGFDVNLRCRGFQYEIGKEYELPEGVNPSLCNAGFHACENPADVFAYYAPSESRYCLVELSGQIVRVDDKSCASRIKIVRELDLQELSEKRRKYVEAHLDGEAKASNTGNRSSASNTGYQSSASNTGNQSSAEVRGKDSVAAVFGRDSKVMGAKGCALFLTERGEWNGEAYPIINVLAVIVDGEKVKEGTWYKLVGGELTEVNEN
jgi:hypothetical protein